MIYFIIIRGPLGCGKSAVARQLATILHAEYIPIDQVLERNRLDKINSRIVCIPAKNFIRANEIILPRVKKSLGKGTIVIFDACFYYKKAIQHLIKNLPYAHYAFTLKAPVEICIERDKNRHKTYGEAAVRGIHKLASRFDYGISIDITRPLDKSVKEILSYLPKEKV